MYKNIMFDLDGTLTDSGRAIIASVEYALSHFGYKDQPIDKLKRFVGPSLYDSFTREYGMNEEDCAKAVTIYRDIYRKGNMYDVDVYEGIPELLKDLKNAGYTNLVITSKPIVFTEQIVRHIGLAPYFDYMVGPDLKSKSSDKKFLIERAISEYGLKREECLMIGDTRFDILGAVDSGVDSMGVTYGFGREEELRAAGATYIVDRAADIAKAAGIRL